MRALCNVIGCDRLVYARGRCSLHDQRQLPNAPPGRLFNPSRDHSQRNHRHPFDAAQWHAWHRRDPNDEGAQRRRAGIDEMRAVLEAQDTTDVLVRRQLSS